ncbi:MAG: phage replisome organizer N-terminal domain-containing protein [Clostridium sp.]|nr:phage replisome organizer N-terminal domain-containing protein [Clostridium sp.]
MKERRKVKINVNMFDDTKLKIIDTKPERDLINYIWFRLITLAGKVDRDGELYLSHNIAYTPETLAIEFNRGTYQINITLDILIELEMIEIINGGVYKVKNFSKHQNIRRNTEQKKETKIDKTEEKHNDSKENENIDFSREKRCINTLDAQKIKEKKVENRDIDSKDRSDNTSDKTMKKCKEKMRNNIDTIDSDVNKDSKKHKDKVKTQGSITPKEIQNV